MSVSSGSSTVFTWFQNLTTISTLFTWVSVCIAYVKFHSALKIQGIPRNTLVFASPFQPYTAWFSFAFFTMVIIFNGFYTFPNASGSKPFDVNNFITAYVGIPIYFGLYLFWKIFKRTKWVKSEEADIHTGKAALDAADAHWPERVPRNILEKIWFFIA